MDSTDIWNVGPFVWTDGGNFTNPKWTTATGYMNSAATEAAVQELVTLDTTGVIGSDFVGGSGAISGETGFPTGQYAMYMDGPWATTTYKDANFTGYGTELIPEGPGRIGLGRRWRGPRHRQERSADGRHDQVRQVPRVAIRAVVDGRRRGHDAVQEPGRRRDDGEPGAQDLRASAL